MAIVDLPGAGVADERHRCPGLHLEVDPVQHLGPAAVGEANVVEGDPPLDASQLDSVGVVAHLGLFVEQIRDLVERGDGREERVVELRELLHRIEEIGQVGEERDQDPDRHLVVEQEVAPVAEHDSGCDRGDEVDDREVDAAQLHRLHVRVPVAIADGTEVLARGPLARERLEHPHARDVLREGRGDRPERLAHTTVGAAGPLAKPGGRERHHRHDDQGREREPPVEEEQDDRRADEQQRVLNEGRDPVGDELVERLDVVRQAADDHAGAIALVEAERQLLEVIEQAAAQVGEHAFAGPARIEGLEVTERDTERARGDERRHEPAERVGVALADLVDRATEEIRRQECDGRGAEQRADRDRRAALVRPGQHVERPQAAPRAAPRPVLDLRPPAAREMAARLVHAHQATSSVKTRSSKPCS